MVEFTTTKVSPFVIVGRKLPFVDVLILIVHSPNCQLKLNWHTLIHLISLFILYLKINYILLETVLFIFIFKVFAWSEVINFFRRLAMHFWNSFLWSRNRLSINWKNIFQTFSLILSSFVIYHFFISLILFFFCRKYYFFKSQKIRNKR